MEIDLASYPRPKNDTGICLHLSANGYYPLGRPEHWDKWIGHAKEMGATWVKAMIMSDAKPNLDDQGVMAIKKLVDGGFQVVLRLFRPTPYPGMLTTQQVEVARLCHSFGVQYFESGNEPNLKVEWKNEDFGQMARENVGHAWIEDAKQIVAFGGYVSIPACAPGGNLDDIWFIDGVMETIAAHMTQEMIGHVWIAEHNYTLNHPLDYPDDDVNRHGTQLTQEEYDRLKPWAKSLNEVNQERTNGKHATGTIMDAGESNSFRKHEALALLSQKHFSCILPVIGTEGGGVLDDGFSNDPRYPIMTEREHAHQAIEISRRTMNNLVPDYFFANCFWLMANRLMENPVSSGFEAHSWFPFWKGDVGIEAVQAMKAMPKSFRNIPIVDITPERARLIAEEHGQEIRIFTGGAIYKYSQVKELGYPVNNEWRDLGFIFQRYEHPVKQTKSVVWCPETDVNKLNHTTWQM